MSWAKISVIAIVLVCLLVVCLTFEVWAAVFLGLLFAISLNGPAEWIRSKWPMPAWAATLLTTLLVLAVMTGLGFVIGPPIVGQADELGKELPAAMEKSLNWLEERKWGRTVVRQVESLTGVSKHELTGEGAAEDGNNVLSQALTINSELQQPVAPKNAVDSSEIRTGSDASDLAGGGGQTDAAQAQTKQGNGDEEGDGKQVGKQDDNGDSIQDITDDDNDHGDDEGEGDDKDSGKGDGTNHTRSMVLAILQTLGAMLSVSAWTIMLLLISFVVMLYVALDPEVYRRGIFWMIPSDHEAAATLTMSRICMALRWWMLGRLASMLAIGLLTSLGMWLIGMPAPLALGALAGLLSFVPNIGPIIAAAPGLLLAVPNGPWMFLSALGVYVVAQIIESNLISPLVDQYTVATPPAVLIFVQVIVGVLAGAWGAVVASPLLVVVLVLIQQLYVRGYLNKPIKGLGDTENGPPVLASIGSNGSMCDA